MNINEAKVVYKPWGKEIWLELNENYCYKRIYINAGHKTSFQYHLHKKETNFLIEGTAEIWLENDNGIIEKTIMHAGDYFNVSPPKKHRVIAITDIILQEVSTPEVDDVIRLEDDTNRKNGKLNHEHMPPAMCIVAAGTGTRLGKLVENFHKGLLPIDNQAILSHIINKTPQDYDIVIAIGFNGNLIKEYCQIVHSDRKITFIEIDDYLSEKSGPGYSLLQCKNYLQRPFYFITADCLIEEEFPTLDSNWLGLSKTSIPELYSTVEIDSNEFVTKLKNKDKEGYENAFIGLCGIIDYDIFWNNLELYMRQGEMVAAFYDISNYKKIQGKFLTWFDIGTIENYLRAQSVFQKHQYGIPKSSGDFVYKVNGNFIKYCSEKGKVEKLVNRAKSLEKIVPKIKFKGKSFYSYEWLEGDTLYNLNDYSVYKDFFEWAKNNLWNQRENKDYSELFKSFYKDKTYLRLSQFLSSRDSEFYTQNFTINNIDCLNIHDTLKKIDFNYISNGLATKKFHGDLQFDNIIYDSKKFTLIDWRPDFGVSGYIGDIYYDLAKIYGGILMSYERMKNDNNISLELNKNNVTFNYSIIKNLDNLKPFFEKWIIENGYDFKKIKIITALIYLNMSALHSKKFGDMLFFKSIQILNEKND